MEYRKAQIQDAAMLLAYKKRIFDESEFLSRPSEEYNVSVEEEQAGIQKTLETENAATWLALDEGEVVGCLNLRPYPLSRQKQTASIGVSVRKDYWSRGIGKTLMQTAVDFFKKSSLHRLELVVVTENEKAIHMYKGFGFEEEGVMREASLVNGRYQSMLSMSMIKSD